jgi:hypothetical protein
MICDLAVGVNSHTESQRVRMEHLILDKRPHEWRWTLKGIGLRSSAIDDPITGRGNDRSSGTHIDRQSTVLSLTNIEEVSAFDVDLSSLHSSAYLSHRLWWDAVAMGVPKWAHMTQKTPFFCCMQTLPDVRDVRSQGVNDGAPIRSCLFRPDAVLAKNLGDLGHRETN